MITWSLLHETEPITDKSIVSSISGKCGLCRCGSIPPQCSLRCGECAG
nr:MAG TPA_asm: Epidermal patterning factor-like protein [Caudoviricetes sp.]